jgi:hypothetical protein
VKIYSFYTPSHSVLFENYFLPTAQNEYDVVSHQFERQICTSGEYQSTGWRETQYNKVLFWIQAIEENMGDIIVCSDVDVQFLGATKKYIQETMGANDLLFQVNDELGYICSGFFACRCTFKTKNFFEIVAKKLKAIMHIEGGGEQYVIHSIFKERWHGLKYGKFKSELFWCPLESYESLNNLKIPETIRFHHANWTTGIDSKIEQLEFVKNLTLQQQSPYQPLDLDYKYNKPKKNPKIALCFSSLLRDFDVSFIPIVGRLLKSLPNKPDLICHFPKSNKHKFNLKLLKSLSPYIGEVKISFEDDPVLDDSILKMSKNMAFQKSGLKGNLLQWHSLKKCAELLKKMNETNQYDWVIWSRPDLYYFNSLDNILNLDNKYYYTSAHDNHLNGINDRFCVGNFQDVYNRMNIYDYFVKEWYPKYHSSKKHLTFSKSTDSYCWNPELVLKHFIKNKLKLKVKKLNFCFGKIRNKFYVTAPFWHSVYGSSLSAKSCNEDIVNHSVLNLLNKYKQYYQYQDSSWPLVNILDDTIMFNHPDRIKNNFHNIPIESYKEPSPNISFFSNLLSKLQSKSMIKE